MYIHICIWIISMSICLYWKWWVHSGTSFLITTHNSFYFSSLHICNSCLPQWETSLIKPLHCLLLSIPLFGASLLLLLLSLSHSGCDTPCWANHHKEVIFTLHSPWDGLSPPHVNATLTPCGLWLPLLGYPPKDTLPLSFESQLLMLGWPLHTHYSHWWDSMAF